MQENDSKMMDWVVRKIIRDKGFWIETHLFLFALLIGIFIGFPLFASLDVFDLVIILLLWIASAFWISWRPRFNRYRKEYHQNIKGE